ncbi:hypothetical protein NFI96_003875 [Prochilodus magdalenae]|nr:hypothetical protein NFI96_003875 [Prochilodus magdalenae]
MKEGGVLDPSQLSLDTKDRVPVQHRAGPQTWGGQFSSSSSASCRSMDRITWRRKPRRRTCKLHSDPIPDPDWQCHPLRHRAAHASHSVQLFILSVGGENVRLSSTSSFTRSGGFCWFCGSNIRPEHGNSNCHEFRMHTFDGITACSACKMLLRNHSTGIPEGSVSCPLLTTTRGLSPQASHKPQCLVLISLHSAGVIGVPQGDSPLASHKAQCLVLFSLPSGDSPVVSHKAHCLVLFSLLLGESPLVSHKAQCLVFFSTIRRPSTGIPQGSVLGPLLSTIRRPSTGIPQGSVLGPLLSLPTGDSPQGSVLGLASHIAQSMVLFSLTPLISLKDQRLVLFSIPSEDSPPASHKAQCRAIFSFPYLPPFLVM